MRVIAFAFLPLVVHGVDWNIYSDETCGTPALEIKGKVSVAATTEEKYKLSHATISTGAPGVCTELAEKWSIETDGSPTDSKDEIGFVKTTRCDEYGKFEMSLYTDWKECVQEKKTSEYVATNYMKTLSAGSLVGTIGGWTSMCHPVVPMGPTADASLSPGAIAAGAVNDGKKPIYWYKINCNPAPGDVAAICLGCLSIVFALAALGLAGVAKGK